MICINEKYTYRPTFIEIWKKGSVEQFSPAPYLATLVNCMVWTLYGLPMVHPNSLLVVTINGSGCVIEIIYVTLFLIYSDRGKRLKVLLWLLVELVFIAALTFVTLTFLHTVKKRSAVVGATCIVFNIMMYASPLAIMVSIINHPSPYNVLNCGYGFEILISWKIIDKYNRCSRNYCCDVVSETTTILIL